MSNPSGKPFEPFDLSAYAPRRARERSVLDPAAVASDEDNNDNSPDGEGRGGGDQVGTGPLPYAARAALRPEVAAKRPVDLDLDLDGGDRSQSPPKPQSQPKLQSEPRPAPSDRPVAAEAAEEAGRDVDLARLESS